MRRFSGGMYAAVHTGEFAGRIGGFRVNSNGTPKQIIAPGVTCRASMRPMGITARCYRSRCRGAAFLIPTLVVQNQQCGLFDGQRAAANIGDGHPNTFRWSPVERAGRRA
jgi:hypothetical protein